MCLARNKHSITINCYCHYLFFKAEFFPGMSQFSCNGLDCWIQSTCSVKTTNFKQKEFWSLWNPVLEHLSGSCILLPQVDPCALTCLGPGVCVAEFMLEMKSKEGRETWGEKASQPVKKTEGGMRDWTVMKVLLRVCLRICLSQCGKKKRVTKRQFIETYLQTKNFFFFAKKCWRWKSWWRWGGSDWSSLTLEVLLVCLGQEKVRGLLSMTPGTQASLLFT